MRYGPNRLIFNSAQALRGKDNASSLSIRASSRRSPCKDIYQNSKVTKSRLYLFSLNNGTPFLFNTLDRDLHLRKRKIISPALSDRSMRMFEPVLAHKVDIFLKQVLNPGSSAINLTTLCRRLSLDIIYHLSFGYPMNLQTNPDSLFSGYPLISYCINTYMNFPSLSKLRLHYLFILSSKLRKWSKEIQSMITRRLQEEPNKSHDFYSFVLSNMEVDLGDMRHSELFVESVFFLSAGK
jgi:cytochrome P450